MKVNRIIGFAALALTLSAAAVSCVKTDDYVSSKGTVAITKVNADLGVSGQQAVTRAIAGDPTLIPAADRAAEGHVMRITISGLTEVYEYNSGKFVPQTEPVYFPGHGAEIVNFWFGLPNGGIAEQDGTAEMLLAADALEARQTFSPASSLSGITLTHVNSLIEAVLDVDPNDVDDVFFGEFPAYNIPATNRYLAIIAPGSYDFKVTLTYKGIPDYKVVVGKDAIVGDVKEFVANTRYTLNLGIDEVSLELRLLAISIARWAEAGNINANAITIFNILNDNSFADMRVTFTDGSTRDVTGINGSFVLGIDTPGSPKVIYSIQRLSGGAPTGPVILIGRHEGEIITLNLGGPLGNIAFRPAVDGSIPIGSYAEFALINTNKSTLADQYLQEADLDLLGFSTAPATPQNWVPIGCSDTMFNGIYEGKGFRIENLFIDLPYTDFVGLFGRCLNGTLRNIHIASGSVTGLHGVAGVCGYNDADGGGSATITDCSNSSSVTGFSTAVGGICGLNFVSDSGSIAMISGCSNSGTVTGSGDYVGGVCGWNDAFSSGTATTIECYSAAAVTGVGSSVGGVCGLNNGGTIDYCFWGKGNSSDASPTVAVGSGAATNTYQFSGSNWPGITSTTGYWVLYPTGKWQSLGAWGGSPQTSTYPVLKR